MHGHCERARQWASADVDGELSTFERALLEDHLGP
jgi:predicted anti-sigma-YlaC factor YlaD